MTRPADLTDLLRRRGLRVTPQRRMILEAMRTLGGHLTVEEIHRAVQARIPGVDLSTVYRTLRLFAELGLLDQHALREGDRVYELRLRPDHAHFVCERCGKVEHLDPDLLEPLRTRLRHRIPGAVRRLTLTVTGLCPQCRAESSKRC